MKLTRHNGRAGKNGIYNPKHNDRTFNIENSEHIDSGRALKNIYWNCYQGITNIPYCDLPDRQKLSFEEVEKNYYSEHYQDFIYAQNKRNEKNRHPERNRTVEDLLQNNKTCPEETIYQIGNIDESISPEELFTITDIFFRELEARYGEHFHILDWALHVDEGTPHIHERHVFDCENKYGELCPQQEKALEKMGIPLPKPDKPKNKNNNRKVMFDAMCRELLMDICEKRKMHLDREPVNGGKVYLEKKDFIIENQKKRLAETEKKLEEVTMKLDDVEKLVDEITDDVYEKACEVITDTVREETQKADLKVIGDYTDWLASPERKAKKTLRDYAIARLENVQKMLKDAAASIRRSVHITLHDPQVQELTKAEIRKKAKQSVIARLQEKKELVTKREKDQEHGSNRNIGGDAR